MFTEKTDLDKEQRNKIIDDIVNQYMEYMNESGKDVYYSEIKNQSKNLNNL